MSLRIRNILGIGLILVLIFSIDRLVYAYGYNFVFPAARRSGVSGYSYADPINPGHLAWDFRFPMHTSVAAAQGGWVATSRWYFDDDVDDPPTACNNSYDDRGNFIVLNHTGDDRTEYTGLETWYFHLSRTGNQPVPGNYFAVGQEMAVTGDTGFGKAHLHFASKNNGTPFNPYEGETHWVSGRPIPMGYRNQYGTIQGPFALDNVKIRDAWIVFGLFVAYTWFHLDCKYTSHCVRLVELRARSRRDIQWLRAHL